MNNSLQKLIIFAFPVLLLSAAFHCAEAQSFGKNKVQYTKFNWYFIQSDHFDVYFTDGGEKLAEYTALTAEAAYKKYREDFRYDITARIPFVVYNSHNDFQQTNVVNEYLQEGIGGVTEMFKNRITIPFEGSYQLFKHVIAHELGHAIINDMIYGGSLQSMISNGISLELPLWFNEGICEYEAAGGWDTHSDMFLRDVTTSNFLPPIRALNGYFAYRGGQSLWWYIGEKYGRQKVGEIVNKIRYSRNVETGFKAALGLSIEELSERWQKEQKVLYYPDIASRVAPTDYAKRLTNHTKLSNFYNTSPAISPSGDRIAFISDRDDFFGVFIMSAQDGSNVKRIILGNMTNDFEELHLLTPGITWSPDGKFIAFSSKAGATDAINIINVETGDRKVLPIEKDGIYSVVWSPQGDKLAFVGNSAIQSDIWVYDMQSKQAVNLTDDIFTDAEPSWSPDGKKIFFTSDRKHFIDLRDPPVFLNIVNHDVYQKDLYAIDIETRKIERLSDTPGASESYPLCSPDGKKLLFISDKNGINNLFIKKLDTGEDYPITNSLTGVYQISLSADGNKLAFVSMHEAGFDVFLMKAPFDAPKVDTLPPTEFMKRIERDRAQETSSAAAAKIVPPPSAPQELKKYDNDVSIKLGQYQGETDSLQPSGGKDRMLFQQSDRNPVAEKKIDLTIPRKNLNEKGEFIINKYKLSFSPDLVYGNAGYNGFYGVLGSTQIAFSDMLGNHQIYFLGNIVGSLKNADLALAYFYLPNRMDWSVQAFQTARYLYGSGDNYDSLYLFRQYGGGIGTSYPFDRFNRLEASLTYMIISQENLDAPGISLQTRPVLVPNVGYVHDNSLWGMWSPVKGSRYEIRLFGSPGIGENPLQFASLTADARTYYKLGDEYSFALRCAGGGSVGKNPQGFFIGGTENWINRRFENGHIPITSAADFAFLTAALPLRGYYYNARIGTKYLLGNAELRFPLVKYFFGGVLPYILQMMNGVMFIDIGTAINDVKSFKAYTRDDQGNLAYGDLLIGTGFGMRMWFLGFPLKFDVGWPYNGAGFGEPIYYFSLGADF